MPAGRRASFRVAEPGAFDKGRRLPYLLHGSWEIHVPRRRIDPLRLSTLVAVAILVGTEVVGASWAAGWALGGMLQLPPVISRSLEVIFGLSGFVLLFFFMRTAVRHEPIRH